MEETEKETKLSIMSEEQVQIISLKHAKSMTGHVYSYAVQTAGEFISRISQDYSIATVWLHLFDPTLSLEDPMDGSMNMDTHLHDEIIYAIFMDTPTPQLLHWIDPEMLNPHMRIENPSYILTEHEATHFTHSQLDYLAMYTTQIDIFETQLHRLSENGWKRFFYNLHAVPILEKHFEKTKQQFYENAPRLAMNPHAIPLIIRFLEENTPMRRPDLFWRNLIKNESAMSLLERYPEERDTRFLFLSENPSAIPFIQSYLDQHPEAIDQFHWGQLSAMSEAMPLLFQYPHKVSRSTIMYNSNSEVVRWIRMYLQPYEVDWRPFCSHTGQERMDYIKEYIQYITEEGWNALSHSNSDAIPFLKCHPEKIHWSLLCCNPSSDVIPMIKEFVTSYEETGFVPFVSHEMTSLLGFSLAQHNIRESYRGKDLWHTDFKYEINLGALTLHPHALSFLEKRPEWIYSNSFSVRPDIYQIPTGTLL